MVNEQLSEDFYLKEFIYSYTAEKNNIPNIPEKSKLLI
jgi:hypothetical protein